jgi:caa(3)-type oxidase subunit IV
MTTTESAARPATRTYVAVWIALLAIVAVEIVLTYAHLSAGKQLAALLVLALIEAGIALLYFMHLRYERALLFWCVVGCLVFALVMLDQIWPDAFRLVTLHHGP